MEPRLPRADEPVSAAQGHPSFDHTVAAAVEQHDIQALLSLASQSDAGRLARPSPDHWLPLLYALGASDDSDTVRFANESFDWGSISMRTVVWHPD